MVAGLVITYMRPFRVGDVIQLGEFKGEVVEKNLLITRIKTPKNEEITIPNAAVLAGQSINFSVAARAEGLALYTTVTIGYDVPWQKVHDMLVEAAKRTNGVIETKAPFVLQTSLDDFYVSYQLNAFTQKPMEIPAIYSALHAHIQDVFNENGIEIMSPHYRAARDGNTTTVPASYLPTDYAPPAFQINTSTKAK
jgi:small-conductance mechanosensitive channel